MKRIIIFAAAVGAFALFATSCIEIDNFDAPESRFYGTITDSGTGKPILTDQGHTNLRMWEKSFEDAKEQEIPIKQDGTYNNHRLFPGHYDMAPIGPWWRADTVRNVALGKSTEQNFEVTPYLRVIDFEVVLGTAANPNIQGPYVTVTCKLEAPVTAGLPQVQDCRAYFSLTQFCGPGNCIGTYNNNDYRMIRMPTNWNTLDRDGDGVTDAALTMNIDRVKSGYTYFVRIGATVKDDLQGNKYNLSEIIPITIP
jgi:hypothetical protein